MKIGSINKNIVYLGYEEIEKYCNTTGFAWSARCKLEEIYNYIYNGKEQEIPMVMLNISNNLDKYFILSNLKRILEEAGYNAYVIDGEVESSKHSEFDEKQKRIISKQMKMNMLEQYNIFTDTMLVQLLVTVLYIVGSNLFFSMQLSIGSIFAFLTYSTYVTALISAILNIGYFLSGIIPSTKRYYKFMELEEEKNLGKYKDPDFGDLLIQNVTFSYDNKKEILKDINILFLKGSKCALVGKNGSGKSTIINLLTRIVDPSKGNIKFNETDIADIEIECFRNMISIVSQQIYLFNDTIRNNICLYKEVGDEIIMKAIKDSELEDFIKEVSLDYSVGSNGSMLSGGGAETENCSRKSISS